LKGCDFAAVEHGKEFCRRISDGAKGGSVQHERYDADAVSHAQPLRSGFHPLHVSSRENQVVAVAARELFGAFKADAGVTARDENCWHDDLFELNSLNHCLNSREHHAGSNPVLATSANHV
jgi:hypothetical protein